MSATTMFGILMYTLVYMTLVWGLFWALRKLVAPFIRYLITLWK